MSRQERQDAGIKAAYGGEPEDVCPKGIEGHHAVSKSTGKCVNCGKQIYGNFLEFIRSQREDQGEKASNPEG